VRTRSFVLVCLTLLALTGLGGAVYAYDAAHEQTIADGVRVAGIDLGGLTAGEARARLRRDILVPLRRPIVVTRGDRTWTLGWRAARIVADLGSTVDEAVARSRRGNLFTRTLRDLTGKRVDADLEPRVDYSRVAVVRLLDRIRGAVDRKPVDARVDISAAGVRSVPSRTGRAVRASDLHRDIRAAIVSPYADRHFVAHARRVKPKVATEELERRYRTILIVKRDAFRLELYERLKLTKTYPIAVGKAGVETPAGRYTIQNKAINPAWHVPDSDWAGKLRGKVIPGGAPDNPIKARWLGVYDGVGVHGTSDDASIGSRASHGCIRMHIPDVEELYDKVDVGSPIYIA
jgi:lipoprotein-anchoring transpeptidase ErfK/SrfK